MTSDGETECKQSPLILMVKNRRGWKVSIDELNKLTGLCTGSDVETADVRISRKQVNVRFAIFASFTSERKINAPNPQASLTPILCTFYLASFIRRTGGRSTASEIGSRGPVHPQG